MKNNTDILPDKPLIDPKQDRFGYNDFSKHLAESIMEMSPSEGLVIALYGQWGTGKTTITNFILHYLQKEPIKKRPIIVKFNPWWFSGEENLISRFFQELRLSFEKDVVVTEKLNQKLEQFTDILFEVTPDLPWYAKIPIKLLQKNRKEVDLSTLKESISKTLSELNQKIVVVIDDIDRLTAEEIRQIFKLVKAVADFPNVIYLLSFDKKIAIEALKKLQDLPGEEYLEKIVQAPFEVPLPEKSQINNLLVEKLNALVGEAENEEYDQTLWQNLFFNGLENFITTPRKVLQIYNALSVTYPAVKGEVNNVDFIAIEILRVFSQKTFDMIRQNKNKFAGFPINRSSSLNESETNELKAFHKAWLDALPASEREILTSILPTLFPKLRAVLGGYGVESDNEANWRLMNRVCHPDVFPIYFRLSVSSDTISTLEMKAIVSLSSDRNLFAKRLVELSEQKFSNGTSHAREVLERLRDYGFEKIPKENIPNIVEALFDIGDKLLIDGDKGQEMFDYDNNARIGRALWPLFGRNDKDTNLTILKKAIQNGSALCTICREVGVFGQQHGKNGASGPDPEREQFTTSNGLKELENLSAKKIREAAEKGTLLDTVQLNGVLYRWKDWAGEKEVQDWVKKTIQEDDNLIKLLEKFLSYTISYSSKVVKHPRLDPDWLKPFVDIESIIERVKKLSKRKKLTLVQKEALNRFLKEYEIRKEGKDPSNPLAYDK